MDILQKFGESSPVGVIAGQFLPEKFGAAKNVNNESSKPPSNNDSLIKFISAILFFGSMYYYFKCCVGPDGVFRFKFRELLFACCCPFIYFPYRLAVKCNRPKVQPQYNQPQYNQPQ